MRAPQEGRSDEALLAAYVRRGEPDALVSLVTRHSPRLYRLAVALTAAPERAQRLVQECWADVLSRGRALLDAPVPLVELVRDEVALRALAARTEPEGGEAGHGPLERAVALLPARERAVYVLHDVGGMTPEQVARVLRMPVAQVKVELWHARLAVQTLLGSEGSAPTETRGAYPAPPALADRIVAALLRPKRPTTSEPPAPGASHFGILGGGVAAAVLALASLWQTQMAAPSPHTVERSSRPPSAGAPPRVRPVVVQATHPLTPVVVAAVPPAEAPRERDGHATRATPPALAVVGPVETEPTATAAPLVAGSARRATDSPDTASLVDSILLAQRRAGTPAVTGGGSDPRSCAASRGGASAARAPSAAGARRGHGAVLPPTPDA